MKGYIVYSKIQQLKEKGFKKATVARTLCVNRRTVDHYWNMAPDVFEAEQSKICRQKMLANYQDIILKWMFEYSSLSAAQVCDWLKEHYQANFSERTVSRYVKDLRGAYNIKKQPEPRSYEAVPERPMGKQVQVDFGEKWIRNIHGSKIKVYCVAFVLACSRYKYAELQSRPYKAVDLVAACHRCFSYLGGMPEEMVLDQDSIVCVSENNGDIIHTYEFERFRQDTKLSIYMCRGADPESKGMVENTVKYIKGNFLENRLYIDDAALCAGCLAWLERTANAKVHGTTKKIPAEVFKSEREFLRPLVAGVNNVTTRIIRNVRKDNTIIYNSNRYSVPFGTCNKEPEVQIIAADGILKISNMTDEAICEHKIATGRGLLIQSTSHRRDRTSGLDKMQNELNNILHNSANVFLETIRQEKSRYARDQFCLLQTMHDQYGTEAVLEAVAFCNGSKLYSVNYVRDYLLHRAIPLVPQVKPLLPVKDSKYHVSTEKRALDVYAKAGETCGNAI